MPDNYFCYFANGTTPVVGFVFNNNGTVYGLSPDSGVGQPITQECCEALGAGYTWNANTSSCYWQFPCNDESTFKVVLPADGNDGVFFSIEDNEQCALDVSFDYLVVFDCIDLWNCSDTGMSEGPTGGAIHDVLGLFTNFTIQSTIESAIDQQSSLLDNLSAQGLLSTLRTDDSLNITTHTITPYTFLDTTNSLADFLSNNTNTGIYFSGSNCTRVVNTLLNQLGDSCSVYNATSFSSSWKHVHYIINSASNLNTINGHKIKLGIDIGSCRCNFTLFLDNIQLNKVCQKTITTETYVSHNIGFDLERKIDNKKSWIYNEEAETREYDLFLRETKYDIVDPRLVINSKEVDLNLDIARAIENDVYCFINDNQDCFLNNCIPYSAATIDPAYYDSNLKIYYCPPGYLLVGRHGGNSFCQLTATCETGTVGEILTTPFSAITNPNEFTEIFQSELIDAKDRKTLQSYPTLRYIYDGYLNPSDWGCTGTTSNMLDYCNLNTFVGTISSYWSQLIAQFVPATTIWGCMQVYRNTIFDTQKFQYRCGSTFLCTRPTTFCTFIGSATTVFVTQQQVLPPTITNCITTEPPITTCSGVYCVQLDMGSEFIGHAHVYTGGGGEGGIEEESFVIVNEH